MNSNPATDFTTIDEYIALQAEPFRTKLEEIRTIVLSVIPEAEQLISYRIPSFKYLYMLVGMGVTKTHCSFYTMSSAYAKTIGPLPPNVSLKGTTLHFSPHEPLPVELIQTVTAHRMVENERIFEKKQKKTNKKK